MSLAEGAELKTTLQIFSKQIMSMDALYDRLLTVPWKSALPKAYRNILLVPLIGLLQFCSHSTML